MINNPPPYLLPYQDGNSTSKPAEYITPSLPQANMRRMMRNVTIEPMHVVYTNRLRPLIINVDAAELQQNSQNGEVAPRKSCYTIFKRFLCIFILFNVLTILIWIVLRRLRF